MSSDDPINRIADTAGFKIWVGLVAIGYVNLIVTSVYAYLTYGSFDAAPTWLYHLAVIPVAALIGIPFGIIVLVAGATFFVAAMRMFAEGIREVLP